MHPRTRRLTSALALVVAVMLPASSAEAQRAAGPFAGLLGAGADVEARQTLDVSGSLFGAWDDTLTSSDASAVDRRFLRSGLASGASGSVTHVRRSSLFQWQSGASSSLRLYGTKSSARAATFSAQTSASTRVAQRVSLSASGGWSYSPYYSFAPGYDGRLSNEGAFGGGFGVATAAKRNTILSAGGGMSWQLSRRDTFSLGSSVSRSAFLDQSGLDINAWAANARFGHQLTRALGFRAGFGRTQATYQSAGNTPATSDTIELGIDYGDALVFRGRQTSLSFAWSTGAVRWNDETRFRLNGSAALTRGFGRAGSAALQYNRATDFEAGFRQPVLRDTVSAGVNNQLGTRTTWSTQVSYARGTIGFGSSAGRYTSYNAGGGMSVAVTRRIGVFTDYSVYRYEVPSGATVFTSLPKFSRQSVTAGLSLWAPLIADKRSSRDSR